MAELKDIMTELCRMYPNGWTHETALGYIEDAMDYFTVDGNDLIYAIRHEATSIDGILRETNGNYTLRSK
jgi:hypothetical protein